MSIYPRQRLGDLIAEVSERNRAIQCTDVYSVTNRQGFVPSEDYFNKKVFSKDLSNYKLVRHEMFSYNPSRINVGSIAYLREKKCVAVSPLYVVFRIKESVLLPAWLEYFLRSNVGQTQIRALTSGSVRDSLKFTALERIEIPLVPKEIQESNLANLSALDKSIAICETLLEKLDMLVKSQFVEMFGDLRTNSKKWITKPLGDLCSIYRGGSPRPINQFLGGDVPWIKIGDATKGDSIYLHRTSEHIKREGVSKSRMVKNGSLIFANCGVSLGFARITTFDGCIHDGWLSLEDVDTSLDKVFLLLSLNQMTEDFRMCAPTGTQPNLNTAIMKAHQQILPPLPLQQQYVSFIQHIDKSEFLLRQLLEKQQTLKKALIQEYFS